MKVQVITKDEKYTVEGDHAQNEAEIMMVNRGITFTKRSVQFEGVVIRVDYTNNHNLVATAFITD